MILLWMTLAGCAATVRIQTDTAPATGRIAARAITLRAEPGWLIGVFDSNTGVFWWRPAMSTDDGDANLDRVKAISTFFGTDDRLVAFSISRARLAVRESRERSPSLERAMERAQETVDANVAAIRSGAVFQSVSLGDALAHDFFNAPGAAFTPDTSRIERVSRRNGTWELVIQGRPRRRAVIVLDDSFALVSANEMKPATP